MYFNQTFDTQDVAKIAVLVVLEAVLSIDNALVLGLLAKRLPAMQRAKALTLGLIGAFAFRFISIATAQWLLKYTIVKFLGGLYLLYVSVKYFWDLRSGKSDHPAPEVSPHSPLTAEERPVETPAGRTRKAPGFWSTVLVIELTDIAFAVDSIVAAIGLVGPAPSEGWHPKLWVVVTGGMLGVILMRYAATVFIRLLELFPRFETAAYLLVAVIGAKLMLDWGVNTPEHPHRLDFHDVKSVAFWVFWLLMLVCFSIGFIPKRGSAQAADVGQQS
jgi:YkoY family integral membrane protein